MAHHHRITKGSTWTRPMVERLAKIAPLLRPSWSPSLGRHLLASKPIKAGTILCEEPVPLFFRHGGIDLLALLNGQAKVREAFPFFDSLYARPNEAKRKLFEDLSDQDYLTMERMETNGFDGGSINSIGLSLFVSMASHGCKPTASYGVGTWYESKDSKGSIDENILRAIAIKDIKEGEEVTIRYGPCGEMADRYGFSCSCEGACLESEEVTKVQAEFIESLREHRPAGEMILLE